MAAVPVCDTGLQPPHGVFYLRQEFHLVTHGVAGIVGDAYSTGSAHSPSVQLIVRYAADEPECVLLGIVFFA